MRFVWVAMALLIAACAANTPKYSYQPAATFVPDRTAADRRGQVLLATWTECQVDAAAALARSKPDIPAPQAADKALDMCPEEREAWIKNEVSPGVTYGMASQVANSSGRCLYPLLLGYIRLIRSGASAQTIRQWVNAYRSPC